MNDEHEVNPILLDRLSIVEIEPYTVDQLSVIGLKYTLPKEVKDIGMNIEDVNISLDHMKYIIKLIYCNDNKPKGVRKLEQAIRYICSCFNFIKNTTTLKMNFSLPKNTDKEKMIEHFLKTGGFIKHRHNLSEHLRSQVASILQCRDDELQGPSRPATLGGEFFPINPEEEISIECIK
jgi:ATP-dependent Lon protease